MMHRIIIIILFIVSLILLKITRERVFLIPMYITGVIITIVAIRSYKNIRKKK